MENQTDYQTMILIGIGVVIFIAFCMFILPKYGVWASEMKGRAALAEAEFDAQVQIHNAEGEAKAAVNLANAEVERAKGVAKANEIIGQSLKNNESYLRYLWINGLHKETNSVIYVPTEAGLPILEAGRFGHQKEKTV